MNLHRKAISFIAFILLLPILRAQNTKPVFKDGKAQIVEAFNNPEEWVREDLGVET